MGRHLTAPLAGTHKPRPQTKLPHLPSPNLLFHPPSLPPSSSHSPFGSGLFKPSRFGLAHAPTRTPGTAGATKRCSGMLHPSLAPLLLYPPTHHGRYILAHQLQGLQGGRLLHAGAVRGGAARGRELLHAVAAEAAQALLRALAQAAQELLQPRRRSAAALAARWPPWLPVWRGTMVTHRVPGGEQDQQLPRGWGCIPHAPSQP